MIKPWLLDIIKHGAAPVCHFSFGNRARRQREPGKAGNGRRYKERSGNSFCDLHSCCNLPPPGLGRDQRSTKMLVRRILFLARVESSKVRKNRIRTAEKYMQTSKGAPPAFRYFRGRRLGAERPRSEKNFKSREPLVTGTPPPSVQRQYR